MEKERAKVEQGVDYTTLILAEIETQMHRLAQHEKNAQMLLEQLFERFKKETVNVF